MLVRTILTYGAVFLVLAWISSLAFLGIYAILNIGMDWLEERRGKKSTSKSEAKPLTPNALDLRYQVDAEIKDYPVIDQICIYHGTREAHVRDTITGQPICMECSNLFHVAEQDTHMPTDLIRECWRIELGIERFGDE